MAFSVVYSTTPYPNNELFVTQGGTDNAYQSYIDRRDEKNQTVTLYRTGV